MKIISEFHNTVLLNSKFFDSMTFWGSFSSANNLIPQKNKFCKADEIVSKSEIFSREEVEKHEKTGGLDKFNKT